MKSKGVWPLGSGHMGSCGSPLAAAGHLPVLCLHPPSKTQGRGEASVLLTSQREWRDRKAEHPPSKGEGERPLERGKPQE